MILFLTLCQCATEFEKEFLDKLKDKKDEAIKNKITFIDDDCSTVTHKVKLHKEYDRNVTYNKIETIGYDIDVTEYKYDLKTDDDSEIKEIKRFISNDRKNHILNFQNNQEEKEVIEYQKKILNALQKDNILKINILTTQGRGLPSSPYMKNIFYFEIQGSEITVQYVYEVIRCTERIQMKIDNSDITKIIQTYFISNLDEINDQKQKLFFLQYFYNFKMIFFDYDTVLGDAISLEKCEDLPQIILEYYEDNEDNDITLEEHTSILKKDLNIQTRLIVFEIIKGTSYFIKLVERVLNHTEMRRYHIFKKILENLKIDLTNLKGLFRKNNLLPSTFTSMLNEFYAIEITKKIEMLKVSDDIVNYKSLLIFFCQFVEKDFNDQNFFENSKFLTDKRYISNLRLDVIRKLNHFFRMAYINSFIGIENKIVIDFYNKRISLRT